jgi:hypothetical protein
LFFFLFLFFFFSPFFLSFLHFFSFFIFYSSFLFSSELLSNIVLSIAVPSPMLKWLLASSIEVRVVWLLEKYKILVFLHKTIEIFKGIIHVETPHILVALMSPSICYMSWNLARKFVERSSILNFGCCQMVRSGQPTRGVNPCGLVVRWGGV